MALKILIGGHRKLGDAYDYVGLQMSEMLVTRIIDTISSNSNNREHWCYVLPIWWNFL